MKNMIVDVLLYRPDRPEETRVELRVPMQEGIAQRILFAQSVSGVNLYYEALANLAAAIGTLNGSGMHGIALRVREVEE